MKPFVFILIISLMSKCDQLEFAFVEICDSSLKEVNGYKLVLLSDSECGYCNIAFNDLSQIKNKNFTVIVLEYGPNQQLPDEFIIIEGNTCKGIDKPDFFPQVFLFDQNNQLQWKKKVGLKRILG